MDFECYNVGCREINPKFRCETCLSPKSKICEKCFQKGRASTYVPYQKCITCFKRCCLYCLTSVFERKFKFCPECADKINQLS